MFPFCLFRSICKKMTTGLGVVTGHSGARNLRYGRRKALNRSVSTLEEVVAARMNGNQDVPGPSEGDACVASPLLKAVKQILNLGMREQKINTAELARRPDWRHLLVDRVSDVEHHSRLDLSDRALGAIGKLLVVQLQSGLRGFSAGCSRRTSLPGFRRQESGPTRHRVHQDRPRRCGP